MLFLLDQNVDIAVARVLRDARHTCVTTGEIGLAIATDEEVSIWADNRRAAVFTHDREFIQRRRRNTYGKHVRLECDEEDGPVVVLKHLAEIIEYLSSPDSIVVLVSADRVQRVAGRWK